MEAAEKRRGDVAGKVIPFAGGTLVLLSKQAARENGSFG
jgi:hypothetical protein